MEIEFTLNGIATTVEVPGDMPLLWVLRDVLGRTGTKYGCGVGQCGACTVHIDGRASRSCLVPAADLAGRPVTTIEGLQTAEGRAVQEAWLDQMVAQCGYCQPGQIMTAAALLEATGGRPTDDEIDAAMAGVLCRCGTYRRIRSAIARAAAEVGG